MNEKNSRLLLEDPEVIADTYLRDKYRYQLFMGDAYGAILTFNELGVIESHCEMLDQLGIQGLFDRKTRELLEINNSKFKIIGKPVRIDVTYSGVILPKQKDVNGTYVSFWSEHSYEKLKVLFSYYVLKHYNGPYYYEYAELDDFSKRTTIVPFISEAL